MSKTKPSRINLKQIKAAISAYDGGSDGAKIVLVVFYLLIAAWLFPYTPINILEENSTGNIIQGNGFWDLLIFVVIYSAFAISHFKSLANIFSIPHSRLGPQYHLVHLLIAALIHMPIGLFFLFCLTRIGIPWHKAFSINMGLITVFLLLKLPKREFFMSHFSRSYLILVILYFSLKFLFVRFSSEEFFSNFQFSRWYLKEPNYYFLIPIVTGFLSVFVIVKRLMVYPAEVNELGIRSFPMNDTEEKKLEEDKNYYRFDRPSFLKLMISPFLVPAPTYNIQNRYRLWKSGNDYKLSNNYLFFMLILLLISWLLITQEIQESSYYFILIILFIISMFNSRFIITLWLRRIQLNPPEILKPFSRANISNEYYWMYLGGIFKWILLFIAGSVAVLLTSPMNYQLSLCIVTLFSIQFFTYCYSAWIFPQQIKTEGLKLDKFTVLVGSSKVVELTDTLGYMLLMFSAFALIISEYYGFITQFSYITSGVLILYGLKLLYFAKGHWQNIEWGAKG